MQLMTIGGVNAPTCGSLGGAAWLAAATDMAAPVPVAQSASGEPLDLAGRVVLICEDEPLIAYDIASSVEDAGGEVLGPFAAVADALAALDGVLPNLAVLDVNLLDGDVTPVLQNLVASGVPVVVNTGTKLPDEAIDLGVPVFFKPTEPATLIAAIFAQ